MKNNFLNVHALSNLIHTLGDKDIFRCSGEHLVLTVFTVLNCVIKCSLPIYPWNFSSMFPRAPYGSQACFSVRMNQSVKWR